MAEPVFDSVKFSEKLGFVSGGAKIESRTDVLSEEINVLSVSASLGVCNTESLDGQIKYSGKALFYVIYSDSEGVSSCECSGEYSGSILCENVTKGCKIKASVKCEKTDFDLSGTKLSVTGYLTISCEYYEEKNAKFLSDGNIIINKKEVPFIKGYGRKKGVYPIEEEFELNYAVAKVLTQSARAEITAVQCGVGCIIVDGEVDYGALLLQNIEKSDIIREEKKLPFRMEMEYEEAMPSMVADICVGEKAFKTDITVDEDTNKSVISISATLIFEGEVFSEEKITVGLDAFSLTENVDTEKSTMSFVKPYETRNDTCRIVGRAINDELPAGSRIMCVGGEEIDVTSTSITDGKLNVTGILSLNGYVRTPDGGVTTTKWQTPFECNLEIPISDKLEYSVKAKAEKPFAKIISLSEAEIEAEGIFFVMVCEKTQVEYISGIKFCGEKVAEDSAISVYIPVAGEELWSLAKRLNVCPDTLVLTNKELQFPLTGKERIVIYRQK